MPTRAFAALTAEPWAIEASWLPIIAALSTSGLMFSATLA